MSPSIAVVLLASSFLASTLYARIAVYDYRGTATGLGGYSSLVTTGAGALVIDLDTYEATYIGLLSFGSKTSRQVFFQETPLANFLITQIYGPRSQTHTVLAKAEAPGTQYAGVALQQSSAVGLNSVVTIQTIPSTVSWILPRVLTSSGLVLTEDANYDYLTQEKGTYRLNAKVTTSCNNAGWTLSDFVSFVRNIYVQNGIQELVLPPAP
jgi:hypothetical protein